MRAMGLAAMIVVLGVLLPKVLAAVQTFLLVFLEKATGVLQSIPDLK